MVSYRRPRLGHWPFVFLGVGLLCLMPWDPWRGVVIEAESWLLTARALDVRAFLAPAEVAQAKLAEPAPETVAWLRETRRVQLPGPGWQGDGEFHFLTVGNRSLERVELASAEAIPPDEPVLLADEHGHGAVLVGFTAVQRSGEVAVVPVTSSQTRLAAHSGDPGSGETTLFVAQGENDPTLRVRGAESLQGLRDGAEVWVAGGFADQNFPGTWRPPGQRRLRLGTLIRNPDEPDPAEAIRLQPAFALEDLREVAVRYPPGFVVPGEREAVPRPFVVVRGPDHDPRRRLWLLRGGRERGLEVDGGVAIDGALLGRIVRCGFGMALVATPATPGFEQRVFLLEGDRCLPFRLRTRGLEDGRISVVGPIPAGVQEAEVVTARTAAGIPEGLRVGTLKHDIEGWWLECRAPVGSVATVFVHERRGSIP